MMRRYLSLILTVLIAVAPVAQAGEWTQAQWVSAFRVKTEWSTQFIYALLGKAYTDMPLLFSRQVQIDTMTLYLLQKEMVVHLV